MRVAWWLVQVVCLAFGLSASPVALAQRDNPSVGKGLTVPAADPPSREKSDASRPRFLTYDPTTCSRDAEGMVYFAIGRHVYRQPRDNLIRISGRQPEMMRTFPLPPKPGEPEGCPDHPIQGGTFALARFSAVPGGATPHYADWMRVIINLWPLRKNRVFQLVCARSQLRDTGHPGLIGCTKPDKVIDDTVYETTEHVAPDGEKVAFYCDVGLTGREHPPRCFGGYRLHEGVGLNFFFDSVRVPIHEFIGADQELRRRLEAAEVKNYPWATPPDSNETRRE